MSKAIKYLSPRLYNLLKRKYANGDNPIKLYQEDFDEYQNMVKQMYEGKEGPLKIFVFRGIRVVAI